MKKIIAQSKMGVCILTVEEYVQRNLWEEFFEKEISKLKVGKQIKLYH